MAGDDKTEKATPRRRKEARREGRFPRSPDIGAWLSLLVIATLLPRTIRSATDLFRQLMTEATAGFQEPTAATAQKVLSDGLGGLAGVLAPLGLVAVVVCLVAASAQGGLHFAPKKLKPDFKHLNPLQGLKRLFGPQTLWEAAKSLLKTGVCALVLYIAVRRMLPHLALSGGLSLGSVIGSTTGAIITMIRLSAVAGIGIGLADYAVARRRTEKQIRMTKHEVKQEAKQTDGDPHMRAAIRGRQIRMSRNRMMADIATADVIVVNPTHVAVALKYEPDSRRAPSGRQGSGRDRGQDPRTGHRAPRADGRGRAAGPGPVRRVRDRAGGAGRAVPGRREGARARHVAQAPRIRRRPAPPDLHPPVGLDRSPGSSDLSAARRQMLRSWC